MKYTIVLLYACFSLLICMHFSASAESKMTCMTVEVEPMEKDEATDSTETETVDEAEISSEQPTENLTMVENNDLPGATPPPEAAVSSNDVLTATQEASSEVVYTVQLGAFSSRERAFALYWDLSKKISPLQVSAPNGDDLYRVRYGSFPNKKEAQDAVEKIRQKGIQCFVTTVK